MGKVYEYIPSSFGDGFTGTIIPNVDEADLTLSRTSSAYRTNKNGLLELMPPNTPRIDYSDDLNCPSLLLEPQATNLINSDFSSGWNPRDGASISSDYFTSPNGFNDAKLINLGSNLDGRIFTSTGSTNETTLSVFLKKHELDLDGTFPIGYSIGGGIYNKTFLQLTNQWKRYSITYTNSSSIAFTRKGQQGNLETLTRAYVWLPQEEEGNLATSPIPNSLSNGTSTRTADTNVQTGDISQYLNQSEGVLEVELKKNPNGQTAIGLAKTDTTSNDMLLCYLNDSFLRFAYYNSGNVFDITHNIDLVSDYNILKLYYNTSTNNYKLKVNGTEVANETTIQSFEANFLHLKYAGGGGNFTGSIKSIKIYDSINDY